MYTHHEEEIIWIYAYWEEKKLLDPRSKEKSVRPEVVSLHSFFIHNAKTEKQHHI